MCRCYVSPAAFSIQREFALAPTGWEFTANFNTTPGQAVAAIRANDGRTEAVMMRWGLAGHGSFNIPIETLASDTDFGESWKRARRCIIPALGFYEWHVNPDA